LVTFLLGYDFVVLFLLNPHASADYRDTFRPSGAKDDTADACMLLDYLIHHSDRLRPLIPDSEQVRMLASLCEDRRRTVEQRKEVANRLMACLKSYYPQAVKLFDDFHSELTCAFLAKWPEVEAVKKANDKQLREFFYAHQARSEEVIQKRLGIIRSAVPLTKDRAVIVPGKMKLLGQIRLIRDLNRTVEEYDREIERLYRELPDSQIFDSFPGAGAALGPRLLAAFGADRSRFGNPEEIQCLSATAPVTEQSGRSKWVHRRWQRNTFLHQTFQELAARSVRHSPWAATFVKHQTDKGKSFPTAVRALAYKWQRIMFACWQNHTPYDEIRYLEALRRSGSPLVAEA
jgi:transposase